MWLRFDSTLYINKRGAKKLYKLYTKPYTNPASRWFSVSCEMYSLCFKLYTNYTLNPTLRRFKPYTARVQKPTLRRSKPYTASVCKTIHEAEQKPYILFLNTNCSRIVHELFTNWTELMGQLMGINGEIEKPFPLGRGWGRLLKSPSL